MNNSFKRINSLFNPVFFQGWGKSKRYFEGWYYKIVSKDERHAFAIIPGIAMNESGEKQSFIQVLDGKKRSAEYHKFPFEDFRALNAPFNISINSNNFSSDEMGLNLPGFEGRLSFHNSHPWPTSLISPGIMGPFTFVPFMECYHGIVSMDHMLKGELLIEGKKIDFTGGRGYIEKDWGRSFPSAYTWMQSNHFGREGISFKCSIAKIPWLGSSFNGFIAGLLVDGKLFQFTTYNSSKLTSCEIDKEKVDIVLENKKYKLIVSVKREQATALASPIMGLMDGKIEESMSSEIKVKLFDKKNNIIIFEDIGRNAALEVAGKIEEIARSQEPRAKSQEPRAKR